MSIAARTQFQLQRVPLGLLHQEHTQVAAARRRHEGFLADRGGKTIPKPDGHPWLRLTRVVESGFCFTIEPGLYFIDSLLAELRQGPNAQYVDWSKVDGFRKYGGIRIEDNVVITETGNENLTRAAFAHVA